MANRAPSVPKRRLMAVALSLSLSADKAVHPISLNAPPNPSQVWEAVPSLTVTSAVPLVTSVKVPVCQ